MSFQPISQCNNQLDFRPRSAWPKALPACRWKDWLLNGFGRDGGALALDLSEDSTWAEAWLACHPTLALGEIARLWKLLETHLPEWITPEFFAAYDLRWCERLRDTFSTLVSTPDGFQNWVDEKKLGARDLAPLLAVREISRVENFLKLLPGLSLSKSQAVLALEYFVELTLLGRESAEILPLEDERPEIYLMRLEGLLRPESSRRDESWRREVEKWPWPTQVQGQWQRFGDQAGLEIKIRATSPADLEKKLKRLTSIGETWACKN